MVEAGKEVPRKFSGWQKVFEKCKEMEDFSIEIRYISPFHIDLYIILSISYSFYHYFDKK